MIPVSPPAARASINTAGSQNRRRICFRSPGGAATRAPGVYDFKRLIRGFAAIILPTPRANDALASIFRQRGFPQSLQLSEGIIAQACWEARPLKVTVFPHF